MNCASIDVLIKDLVANVRGRRCGGGVIARARHHHRGGGNKSSLPSAPLTFNGREATVEDQLKIAEVTLSEDEGGELLGLGLELGLARQIAGEEVLEDTTVRSVGHCDVMCGRGVSGEEEKGDESFRNRVEDQGSRRRGLETLLKTDKRTRGGRARNRGGKDDCTSDG